MTTMQTIVDRARIPLNDASKKRYTDAELLPFANAGLRQAFEWRPDLRFGSYGTAFSDLALDGTFPISDNYIQVIADYVTFRAETKDDAYMNSPRAVAFLELFKQQLFA